MQKINTVNIKKLKLNWFTVSEAVCIINQSAGVLITESDVYRHALCGDILLSIYFQSPVILRKTTRLKNKIKLREASHQLLRRLCFLENDCFMHDLNLMAITEGDFFLPKFNVIDTRLTGYEYVSVQRLLAHELSLPQPQKGGIYQNLGISVFIAGEIFQTFEKTTWLERIKSQTVRLPLDINKEIDACISGINIMSLCQPEYFPLHHLPKDACFVIRCTEIEKLLTLYTSVPLSTRISSPLARLFWLACWNNESIRSLVSKPYKLLPVFEQWAKDEGITDHFSGDTLKSALERGSPFPAGHGT